MRFAILHRLSNVRCALQRRCKLLRPTPSLVAVCGIILLCASHASAQVSRTEALRMGLESAWQTQVQMPTSGRGIVSAHVWPDASQMHDYAVVELPDRVIRVSAEQLDRKGNPIGLPEAKKLASPPYHLSTAHPNL